MVETGFLFGRYTGETPISGELENPNAMNRLRARLQEIENTSKEIHLKSDTDDNIKYHFPNIDGGGNVVTMGHARYTT